ncbi:MAG: imidazoleglycerol-phosphate dehydratase HisB [Eubacteriales bacterium]|nr:imidazoleglycerol-phosphate dehydratase HisB [Eubacteriales bacterium]MDD3880658.1 imidazoleglycerol-phosphate dehydratase HisB [Eubacteriales bacterium]MDD4513563.1 imidazoleglycerol-phosphate dehydratase HisB [Eubacteriales bacterium]
MRTAEIARRTKETDITVKINLDESCEAVVDTGIGFLDHMLTAFARFAFISLSVKCKGDLNVDGHHTAEDVGIAIGDALLSAIGGKEGIRRMGFARIAMDEALAEATLDLSGRPFLVFRAMFTSPMIGDMDTQLFEEFFRALASHSLMTLHLTVPYGSNSHHMAEAMFKAFGKALAEAVSYDERIKGVMSTKGVL